MLITDVTDDYLEGDNVGNISRGMRETGFHKWGFVIYRAVYGDDELWDRYIAALKIAVHEYLDHCGRDHLLEQYAEWTVMDGLAEEDRNTENAIASKDDVRRLFVQWRDQHEAWGLSSSPLVVVLIDGDYEQQKTEGGGESSKEHQGKSPRRNQGSSEDEDDNYSEEDYEEDLQRCGGFPPIEGCPDKYVGWEYEDAQYLAGAYHTLHRELMSSSGNYQRPPALAPGGIRQVE